MSGWKLCLTLVQTQLCSFLAFPSSSSPFLCVSHQHLEILFVPGSPGATPGWDTGRGFSLSSFIISPISDSTYSNLLAGVPPQLTPFTGESTSLHRPRVHHFIPASVGIFFVLLTATYLQELPLLSYFHLPGDPTLGVGLSSQLSPSDFTDSSPSPPLLSSETH